MFELSSFMTRIMLRQLNDDAGNPTDSAVVSISRLHQFMRPMFFRKQAPDGFSIRLEWLGYYEEGSGADALAAERQLIEKVLQRFGEDSKQFTIRQDR
jgi:hypothetical protein